MPQYPTESVVVDTKSPWASTINWSQLVGFLASLALFLHVPVTTEQIGAAILTIQGLVALYTFIRHTWYEPTVLTSSVK